MSFMDEFFNSFGGGSLPDKPSPPAAYLAPLAQRDYAAAVPLLKSAMNREDARAMGIMAAMTALGRGVEKDLVDACAWFRQAAHRGHAPSQAALGMCLAGGMGTAIDNKEAAYWLYRAGKAGSLQAVEVLGALAYRDHSVVGPHFTEDDLCDLWRWRERELRRLELEKRAAEAAAKKLH